MRVLAIFLLIAAGCAPESGARPLSSTLGNDRFPVTELLEGSESSEAQCATLPFAVWVMVDGKGDCIRYYAGGLKATNPDMLVFFHGDRMALNGGSQRAIGSYGRQSPAGLERDAALWSSQARGLPFLFVGRPGTHGSSGNHAERRRPREVKLMTAALDAIKARHGVQRYHLSGQSGGGHIAGAMLNMRQDVECAAIASGAVAVWKRIELLGGRSRDTTGYSDPYDPVKEVSRIRRAPPPRIFVLSDPEDRTVPFGSQEHYVSRLLEARLAPVHVLAIAPDPGRHALAHLSRPAIRWCAQGVPTEEIRRRLEDQGRRATTATETAD